MLLAVIPWLPALFAGRTRLWNQEDGANIGAADGPKGEPQDAASLSNQARPRVIPGSIADKTGDGPGMTKRKSS
ncbi:MAG TPA: hypothetical protein VFW60_09515 [Rhodanobacteraceae bacterium]|nr:hypothetical protein [Rhodanobacteraceae bacterium]